MKPRCPLVALFFTVQSLVGMAFQPQNHDDTCSNSSFFIKTGEIVSLNRESAMIVGRPSSLIFKKVKSLSQEAIHVD